MAKPHVTDMSIGLGGRRAPSAATTVPVTSPPQANDGLSSLYAWTAIGGIALFAARWFGLITTAQAQVVAYGFFPFAVLIVVAHAFRRMRAAQASAAVAVAAAAKRTREADAKLAEAASAGKRIQEQSDKLNAFNARVIQLERELQATAERATKAEERAAMLASLEPEVIRLRAENAEHAKLTADRREWRTLPQGHDTESEEFAAAVAMALKL